MLRLGLEPEAAADEVLRAEARMATRTAWAQLQIGALTKGYRAVALSRH